MATLEQNISKAVILIEQKKYDLAEKLLLELVPKNSDNIDLLSLLGQVYIQQDKYSEANQIVDMAIGISPDESILFYLKAQIAIGEEKFANAEKFINQAIELKSFDADYFALLANIVLARKKYEKALDFANKALEIDPQNLLGLNVRSSALTKLKRHDESFETIEHALKNDPNEAFTHSNLGWNLLEKGEQKKALEHFKEALVNDPTSEHAKSGMLEAIKATNPIYKLFLKYSFWVGNLSSGSQWAFLVGYFFVTKFLNRLAKANKSLQPYLYPVIIVLGVIAFSTWIIRPISDLLLRFHKFGKFLLNEKQVKASNFVGVCVGVIAFGILSYFVFSDERFLPISVLGLIMILPVSAFFSTIKHKKLFLVYLIIMIFIGLFAIAVTFLTGELFNLFSVLFLLSYAIYTWIANFFFFREDNQ